MDAEQVVRALAAADPMAFTSFNGKVDVTLPASARFWSIRMIPSFVVSAQDEWTLPPTK